MANLRQTMRSGHLFEDELVNIIVKYTQAIWRNIRIETLYTQQGTTEIDILFCYKDIAFVVEAKNVSSIIGDYGDKRWSFTGSTSVETEQREYSALNVITQNNIHVRSLKDLFFSFYHVWPVIVPVIVVPNFCKVSPEIAGAVHTLLQFESLLVEASKLDVQSRIQRRLASIIPGDNSVVQRPDFAMDAVRGKRVKVVSE